MLLTQLRLSSKPTWLGNFHILFVQYENKQIDNAHAKSIVYKNRYDKEIKIFIDFN